MFLQSWVMPVVLYKIENGGATITEVAGTAFFINKTGNFLTAKHVIKYAEHKSSEKDYKIGLVVKGEDGTNKQSFIAEILQTEHAPEPYDISIGFINYNLSQLPLKFKDKEVHVWQRIAAYGYPLNAHSYDELSKLRINMRALKGIVQRVLDKNDVSFSPAPSYETSFLIGEGMSGAPLFIHEGEFDNVIGVCVGCSRSEKTDEVVEVERDGKTYRESKMQITEFGIANDLISLHDWKPSLLNGLSLVQAAT
ncbi:MAG: hypothetical protein DHS20C08_14250 [Rhodomicrobium sp.]|nr:MAG: hypothetical protein DHS20C08_14250 [Rhodomicrobium sp.]